MYGGYSASFTDAAMQRGFDNQAVIGKLDRLGDGLCSIGYDQQAQMNNLGNTVQQTGWNLASVIRDGKDATVQGLWDLSRQQSDCCCKLESGLQDLRYTMAADTCAIKTEIANSTRDIMQNDDANFRALNDAVRDGFCRLENAQKDQYIRQLEQKLNNCDRDSALLNLRDDLIDRLGSSSRSSCCGRDLSCCA